MFYVVIYSNYDVSYEVIGIFTDKLKAIKCKEYQERCVAYNDYGDRVEILGIECSDNINYEAKILELEREEMRVKQEQEEAIRRTDLIEYNRIKEKYGL